MPRERNNRWPDHQTERMRSDLAWIAEGGKEREGEKEEWGGFDLGWLMALGGILKEPAIIVLPSGAKRNLT